MASTKFLSRINWRLIFIHIIASGFIIYAAKVLIYLHDKDFWFRYETADMSMVDIKRMVSNLHLGVYCGYAGLLLGFLLSARFAFVHKWNILNAVIVVILAGLMLQFNFYGWGVLKHIFLLPGSFTGDYTTYIVVNGSVMFVIGILLFFLKPVNRFIDAGL